MWWSHDRKECFLRQSRRSKSFQRKGPSRPRLAIHDHSLTFSNIGNRVQMSISVETLTSADLRAVEFGEALLAHFRRLFRSRVSRVSLESLSRVFQKVLDLFKRAAEFQKYSRARVLRRLSSTHVSDIYRTPSRLASRTSLSTPNCEKTPQISNETPKVRLEVLQSVFGEVAVARVLVRLEVRQLPERRLEPPHAPLDRLGQREQPLRE